MTPLKVRAERALAVLRDQIEKMATKVQLSDTRLNASGGEHVVIMNGAEKAEGEPAVPWPGLEAACASTLAAARARREMFPGDCILFWRVPPEWEEEGDEVAIYLRFSFALAPSLS